MSDDGAAGARPRGRRTGGADTRGTILAVARSEFAAKGYDGASVRGIARAAGVDPALVHHYFGTKERVFVAAMALPFEPQHVLPQLLAGPDEDLGERVVRFFLGVWARPEGRAPFLGMLGSAVTNEQAAAMLREFVSSAILARVASALELPDRELRVAVAAAQLIGMGLLRYVVRVEPLAGATDDEVVALVAPAVQRYLTP